MAFVRRNALHQGLLGGRRGWLAVGAVLWAPRLLRKLLGRSEEVLSIEKLEPGQSVHIWAIPTPTRKQRKAATR